MYPLIVESQFPDSLLINYNSELSLNYAEEKATEKCNNIIITIKYRD